jgi:uncharacterized protein (TIGR03086 family)
MSQEIIDRITGLTADFDRRVQATPADAWGNQSPCSEWKAVDVVAHVANNFLGLTAALTGGERGEFDPTNPGASWNSVRDGFLSALSTGDIETNVPGPMGPMPASMMIGRFVATDVLVHTWDFARAVGGDEVLDQTAVERAYSGLKPMDAMIRRPGMFENKVEHTDGDLQTEFLRFLGRTV